MKKINLSKVALTLSILSIMWIFIFMVCDYVISLPIVYKSAATGKCVKVEIDGQICDCSEIPEKYRTIWVGEK